MKHSHIPSEQKTTGTVSRPTASVVVSLLYPRADVKSLFGRKRLTIEVAAGYYHIGERKLRSMIEEHPHETFYVMNGNRALIKRAKFEYASLALLHLQGESMSEKRRDKRNRILHDGEYQRADGRYRYRYIDEDGREKNVYSWRLDKNDPMPSGKKQELSLREKERQIQADLFDHIVTNGGNYTVLALVEKYVSLKTGVRNNTKAGYQTIINLLKKDPFGSIRIDKVRLSDAKIWLVKLQQKGGRGYSSIHSIRGVFRPAFQMAVDDDLAQTPDT